MQRYPVIRQRAVVGILIADGPTNSAHLADAHKVGFPDFVAAVTFLGRAAE
jgi:hypothetical protein